MAKLLVSDGISQENRLLPALREGYFNVDEMRFEDLMAMSAQYARLLKFTGVDGQRESWRSFFASDEVCILASILALNLKQAEAGYFRFARAWKRSSASARRSAGALEALPTVTLARDINSWFTSLGALSSVAAARARDTIAHLIEKSLASELRALYGFFLNSNREAALAAFAGFDAVWRLEAAGDELAQPGAARERQAPERFLRENFYVFYNALFFLQESLRDVVQLSLTRRNHDPAMGLLIVFLKLYAKVQERINGFTQRHLDFYYSDVLKTRRRDCVPDSVALMFSTDVAGKEVTVRTGTEFRAGVDENGVELIYAADDDLLVTDAKVSALHTLYVARDELSSPENALDAGREGPGAGKTFATAIKLNRILGASGSGGNAGGEAESYPLLGDPRSSGGRRRFEDARVGFAFASNVLLLKQGQRDITLTFRLERTGPAPLLETFIQRLGLILKTSPADAFFKAFRKMFRISLTSETGWLEFEEYLPLCRLVERECEEDAFKILLRLPDGAPAVVPYAQKTHGETYDTELPIIRLVVDPGAYMYPYDLLREMVIREIGIEVEVTGLKDVVVYNQLGQLSTSAQFAPFGPIPARGDYLIVGCYEAARKHLESFDVELEWGGLPAGAAGFEGYYRGYAGEFGNGSFMGRLAVLRDRKWAPAEEAQPEMTLFASKGGASIGGSGAIAGKRRFSFRGLCHSMRPLDGVARDQYRYDHLAKDGFVRLSLSNPPESFGHREYPMALSRAMTDNARRKRFGVFKFLSKRASPNPLPNPPYTPMVNAISVNYRAVSTISLERVTSREEGRRGQRAFHVHPLGLEALSPRAYGRTRLVPGYEADGSLLIGLSASKLSGVLTLFFHLRDDSGSATAAAAFPFSWHYLSSNQWKRLKPAEVVRDTTNGFLSSGIVALDIPRDINRENSILSPDLFWLRVSADDRNLHRLSSLYSVHAHALSVTWSRREGNSLAHLAGNMPAGTIKEARFSIPGIAQIRQITDSTGGMPAEGDEARKVRVSERLRHKNRAVTAWDYERLILQRFPEIFKVKCFTFSSGRQRNREEIKPGHVVIVVIPYLKDLPSLNLEPKANAVLLRAVADYVRALSSAFVHISVRNPAYERVQVRCKVRFRPGKEHGIRLNRLNQDIVDYLSPWTPGGREAQFGWSLRCSEIQSYIQGLEDVEFVSGLSLLHISEVDGGKCRLSDTARQQTSEVRPSYPWSLAVPFSHHLIEVMNDNGVCMPVAAGISDLAIGSSFILSRDHS